MSFLYPRVISITRPQVQSGVGATGYGGLITANETVIASGIPASIQLKKQGSRPESGLPSDITKRSFWQIYFKSPLGMVSKLDVITDDLGVRYQVSGNYWNSMGYAVMAEELGM